MAELRELQQAAADVIGYMKTIGDLSNARVSVIGGLALWAYITNGRSTLDVDFIINIDSAPASVKQKLLALPNTPFVQHAQFFYYVTPEQNYIQIDITPGWQSPYIPADTPKLKNIQAGSVPYIPPVDLIVFKINSCGLRADGKKKETDASDAEALLNMVTANMSINLTTEQQAIVENGLADVLALSSRPEKWWREGLGLPQNEMDAAGWLWDAEAANWYRIHEDGSCEWFSQASASTSTGQPSRGREAKNKGRRKR